MIRALALSVAVAVASIVLPVRSAWAEPANGKATPVYVLSVWTNDADDQADALTQALRSRVRQLPGWSLAETNQSFETLAIALRCPPTPNQLCLDRIGDQLHAEHYVWGTMAKEKAGEVSADLRLWTRGKPSLDATEAYSDNLKDASDDSLRAVAGRLLAKLTHSESSATLVVHAGTASGAVLVDNAPRGKLENGIARLDVDAGAHSVSLRVAGFTAPAQTATLTDGGEQELSFALTPAQPMAAGEPAPEREKEASDKTPFPVRKVLGYAAVVVGAGFLVAAGIEGASWLSDKNASDSDRAQVPSTVTDVCSGTPVSAAAADACQKSTDASSAAKLGWIFTGVGAVLAGTGIFLVLADPGPSQPAAEGKASPASPRLAFTPVIGPHIGAFDLRMQF